MPVERNIPCCLTLALIAVLLWPATAIAQSTFGTIVGTVTDASQAVVPGTTVTAVNEQTGITREGKTDQYGNYTIGSLLPGIYTVKAGQAGFQLTQVTGVELPVARTVKVDVVLQVGEVSQRVAVTASAPLLDTATSTVGTVVNNRDVVALPLNGRSYTDLILLIPGAVPRSPVFAAGGGHNYSVSGTHPDQNTWTLDGVNNNETFFKQFGIQPSIDAVQEFKVQTNVTSAESGGGAGANVSVALKSGTNELHGAAFEFLRNDKLDANEFFRNYRGSSKPAYRRNQYGGVLGGPVSIPGVYKGKDRAFWLVNYEGLKIRRAATNFATVPTRAQLSGDLRDQPPFFDPATARKDPATGNLIRDPMSCKGVLNVICPDRINPATAAWAKIMYPGTDVPGTGNLVNQSPLAQNTYQVNTRADYKFTDTLTFFARYSHANVEEEAPSALPLVFTNTVEKFRNAVASWTYVPAPTLVFDFKLGLNRSNIFQANSNPGAGAEAYLKQYPLQGVPIKSSAHPLYPSLGITGFSGAPQSGVTEPTTDLQAIFNVSKVKGRHTFKGGFSIDNFRNLSDNLQTASFSFSKVPTADPQNLGPTGSALASFLLGLPSSGQRAIGNTAYYARWGQYHFYVQDDFKVLRRLTLNIGLRYEWNQWAREVRGRTSQFDRLTGKYIWASKNPVTGEPANVRPQVIDPDFNNFAPRFGFASEILPQTTLRGGYSIFYATNYLWEIQGPRGQWPFALSEFPSGINTADTLTPIQTLYSPDLDVKPGAKPSGFWALNRRNRTSYTQQWNLGVQRQLANDLMLEVDYVGTKGTKMPVFMYVNMPPPGPGVVGSAAHPRPFPQAGLQIEGMNMSTSIYHSLQSKLEKKFSSGLQFLGSYTWGHYIDVGGAGNTSASYPADERNYKRDRGPGAFDFRHTFTGSYLYQLPFGRGKAFLAGATGPLNQLAGGWEVTGIVRYTSGPPVNVGITYDAANIGFGQQRPDRVLNQPMRAFVPYDKTLGWLNPAAFKNPAQYSWGNLGRNTERGPGTGNWDLGLFKNFPFREDKARLQFRAELFNAFNNVNLGSPSGAFGDPSFGRIFGAALARQIQFGLKLLF